MQLLCLCKRRRCVQRHRGEVETEAAPSQGVPAGASSRGSKEASFPGAFREGMVLMTPGFWTVALKL